MTHRKEDEVPEEEESFSMRLAGKGDAPELVEMIRELAAYENLEEEVVATPELLVKWMFDEERAEAILAVENGNTVGFALFFTTFSTFLGRPGLYLEDLYIKPECRGKGYGKILLAQLARLTVERGYGRLEWWCLDWNKPSIQFYLTHGAEPMDEWTVYRLSGEDLEIMAQETKPIPPDERFGSFSGTRIYQ